MRQNDLLRARPSTPWLSDDIKNNFSSSRYEPSSAGESDAAPHTVISDHITSRLSVTCPLHTLT